MYNKYRVDTDFYYSRDILQIFAGEDIDPDVNISCQLHVLISYSKWREFSWS